MNIRLAFLNLWWSVYYPLTRWLPSVKIQEGAENREDLVVVSLTTKPSRISKVWLAIESILRQEEKPDLLILYLSKEEFPKESKLPQNLLGLKKRGLKIQFVDGNLKPHNKYFFAMREFPQARVITVDDDKIYPPTLVRHLKECHRKFPQSICAAMTRRIMFKGRQVTPYTNWPRFEHNSEPVHSLIALGVCGVLYPPYSLHEDLFDFRLLQRLAPLSDDIWLKIMALKNNTRICSAAGLFSQPFVSIRGAEKEQLTAINISQGQNDVVLESLLRYFQLDPQMMQENSGNESN